MQKEMNNDECLGTAVPSNPAPPVPRPTWKDHAEGTAAWNALQRWLVAMVVGVG